MSDNHPDSHREHTPVAGYPLGRIDSILRRISFIFAITFVAAVFIYIFIVADRQILEFMNAASVDIAAAAVVVIWLLILAIFGLNWLGHTRQELENGYTTLYSRRLLGIDLIDWKTGVVIVPAGGRPLSRAEFNARVRAARRAQRLAGGGE